MTAARAMAADLIREAALEYSRWIRRSISVLDSSPRFFGFQF